MESLTGISVAISRTPLCHD